MEIYSINNFKELEKLYFHDSELQNIIVAYINKETELHLITAVTPNNQPKNVFLLFNVVYDLHVPMVEPWGSGFYVNSIGFKKLSDKQIKTSILLNSGDEITCISETIKIKYAF